MKHNIKELNKAKVNQITLITKGAGRRAGSARVEIVAYQTVKDSVRKIKIDGDLHRALVDVDATNEIYKIFISDFAMKVKE